MYYSCGIKQARTRIAKRLAVGFNSCVDIINYLPLRKLEKAEQSEEISPLLRSIEKGEQGEVAVSKATLGHLVGYLGYSEKRAGGLVGHAAVGSQKLGIEVYAHLASKCSELVGFFPESVFIAGEMGFLHPSHFHKSCSPPEHYVLELGDSKRFIFTHDEPAFSFTLDRLFLEQVKQVELEKVLLSGFHLVSARNAKKIEALAKELEEWRELNPRLFIHLELGQFQSARAYRAAEGLFPLVDSVGLNQEELYALTSEEEMVPALEVMAEKAERVLFHSQHLSALLTSLDGYREARASLQFASLTAAFRLLHGQTPGLEQLEGFSPPEPSREGMRLAQKLKKRSFSGKRAIAVPSLYVGSPRRTVGIGDSFATAYTLVV